MASLTAKILCKKHNNALSDVDAAGAAAFRVLQDAATLQGKRQRSKPRKWKQVRFEIDGRRLERWFLKTLINVGASNSTSGAWALTGAHLAAPPDSFIAASFGLAPLKQPFGLYAVGTVGEDIVYRDGVELRTLLDKDGALAGALFVFLGFRFFLNLQSGPVPQRFSLPSNQGWLMSAALYHVTRINAKVGGKRSHYT